MLTVALIKYYTPLLISRVSLLSRLVDGLVNTLLMIQTKTVSRNLIAVRDYLPSHSCLTLFQESRKDGCIPSRCAHTDASNGPALLEGARDVLSGL